LKSKWDDKTPSGVMATPGSYAGMTPLGGMTPGMMGITPDRLK